MQQKSIPRFGSLAAPADNGRWSIRIHAPRLGSGHIFAGSFAAGTALVAMQAFIDPEWTNIYCAILAALSMAVTFAYCFHARVIRIAPLSTLSVLGFNMASMTLALIAQTVSMRPLTYYLQSPELTFGYSALSQLILLVVHGIYMRFSFLRKTPDFIARRILRPLWFFRLPATAELWIVGIAGFSATLYSQVTAVSDIDYGDVGGKFLQSLSYFILFPYFIPFRGLFLARPASKSTLSLPMLAPYTLAIILLAMATNKRVLFALVGFTTIISMLMMIWMGRLRLKPRTKLSLFAVIIIALPLLGSAEDLSTAITIARGAKGTLGTGAFISETIKIFGDKTALAQARQSGSISTGVGASGYSDNYISSQFIARLSFTKYTDLTMTESRGFGSAQREAIKGLFVPMTAAMIPTPIIRALGLNVDKNDLEFSVGDLYEHLATNRVVGSYLTGSSITHIIDLVGDAWPIAFAVLMLGAFFATDSFTLVSDGRVMIAPAAFSLLFLIFDLCLINDSVTGIINTNTRVYMTDAFCYMALSIPARFIVAITGNTRPGVVRMEQVRSPL